MAVILSPGVFPREIDLSVLPAAVGPLRPAFVGTAKKGPLNTPTYVTSAQMALDKFGEPFAESYLMYAVLAYFEEGNECYITRVGVEYDSGQDTALNSVAISTDGSKAFGWGRIPIFTGIEYGKILLREVSSATPLTFHAASVGSVTYNQPVERPTEGATAATLNITGTYTGAIDDSIIMYITGAPTLSSGAKVDGATYEIIRNSDGTVLSTGTLLDALHDDTSQVISLGNGLSVEVSVEAGVLNTGDTFVFSVTPDNRKFTVSVENASPVEYTMPSATYSTAASFVAAFNGLLSGESYAASLETVTISGVSVTVPAIKTTAAGEWLQLTGSAGFSLEVGTSQYAFNIPRGYLLGTEVGPYNINSNNNRVKIDVLQSSGTTTTVEFNIPTGTAQTVDNLVSVIDSAGVVAGDTIFESINLTAPGGTNHVLIILNIDHLYDTLVMKANYSNVKTLRFAQTIGVSYPYKGVYTGYSDSRLTLPDSSSTSSTNPRSCELNPLSADCALDSAYYQNIVGYLVATSAGTWVNNLTVDVDVYTDGLGNPTGRYTVTVQDGSGVALERFTDVVFDKTADRYIGNFLNPGTKYGGTVGANYINWEERPAYLNNDPLDTVNYQVRNPSVTLNKAFLGGANGIPTDPAYSTAVDAAVIGRADNNSGIYSFQNIDAYDVNLLLTPGFSSGAVIGTGLQIAQSRGDLLYIVDPPFGLRPQQIVDWHNGMLTSDLSNAMNSSYGALYWGWVKYYDQFNVNEIWVPPSGHVAAIFSRTARTTEQWFAPAGLTRGRILTALELEYTPSVGENDLLYGSGNAVNPIVKFPQDGIVVWGNRTLQRTSTALNRVNVRMLLNYLKKSLTQTLRSYVFEPNDRTLWSQVVATINPFMGDIQSRRGITAFKVVCDATNNTPERIDRNELWVSVFIKPTKSVEFIILNLAVVNTGASFSSEAVLQAGGIVSSVATV